MNTKYKLGVVSLTKWDNGEKPSTYTMERSFKRENSEEWEANQSFGRDDLLKLKTLIDKALDEDIKTFEN